MLRVLTRSYGILRGDVVHCEWVFDLKVVTLWVAMEIVTKATTTKKFNYTYLCPGGGEEIHLWLNCLPISQREKDKI